MISNKQYNELVEYYSTLDEVALDNKDNDWKTRIRYNKIVQDPYNDLLIIITNTDIMWGPRDSDLVYRQDGPANILKSNYVTYQVYDTTTKVTKTLSPKNWFKRIMEL